MKSKWKKVKIKEIADIIMGQSPPSSTYNEEGKGLPFYQGVVDFGCRFVTPRVFCTEPKKVIDENYVLLSVRAPVGEVNLTKGKCAIGRGNAGLKEKRGQKLFLYYLLKYNMRKLKNSSEGTVFSSISKSTIENLEIEIPKSLDEQKAIASVLSSLDDKIDLLHRQNKTLEKMAETLFRQWFVEEAKEDWEEKKLEEVCVIRNGYAFKSETYQEIGQKIIRTLNFKNGFVNTEKIVYISDELAKFFSKYFLNRKDFLLVMVGANIGNYAVVTKDILPALQNQNMWCFKALQPDFQFYLNYYLKQMIKEKKNIVSGSAREFFQKKVFANFIIPIPENIKLRQFNEIVEDIFSKIENNRTQIRTLEKLWDTLLPKLMSGQIRVKI